MIHKMRRTTYEWQHLRVYPRIFKRSKTDRQLSAHLDYGIKQSLIYTDRQSGKDFNRPAYKKVMKPVDTLVIKSIDRLGRNYEEIIEQWRIITKEKRVDIVVIDMPLLDTRQGRNLTGTLIADLVLQILSYVAQKEREFIRQRQAEGIAAAHEKGVVFGRPPKAIPNDYKKLLLRWKANELSARQAAALLGVSHVTFLKWAKEEKM